MNNLRTIFFFLFIVSIPILLVSSAIVFELNLLPFYEYAYQKYHINQVTGFSDDQLMKITRHLIQFFNGKINHVQLMVEKDGKPIYLFHDYEIKHLNDVKVLFRYTFQALLLSLVYFLGYLFFTIVSRNKRKWYYFWQGLRKGSLLAIGLLLILGVSVFFGFQELFIRFHYLVFGDPQNSPWMLDPRTDYLIMMYPLNFWQDAAILGIGIIITTALVLIVVSSIASRRYVIKRRG